MKKVTISQESGYEVTVDLGTDLNEYALSFLKIFNNVKSSKELIRVTNDYHNRVSVVCVENSLGATKEFLRWFGDITGTERVLLTRIEDDIDYDLDKYDDLIIVPWME